MRSPAWLLESMMTSPCGYANKGSQESAGCRGAPRARTSTSTSAIPFTPSVNGSLRRKQGEPKVKRLKRRARSVNNYVLAQANSER
jgi:hypothetical protein